MEEVYINLYENKKKYTDDELMQSINENYDEDELLDIEDGYGEKFVTLIAKRNGINMLYKVHEYYKNNPTINDILFKKELHGDSIIDICNLNYHPLGGCYNILGIEGCFEMIDKIYDKNFNLLFDLTEYTEYPNIVIGIFETDCYYGEYIQKFLNLLLKYNVDNTQFRYTKLIKISYDIWSDSSDILKWLLLHNIYNKKIV